MGIFFHNIIQFIESSKYILLFIGMIVEGPVIMVASGFLYKLGQFNLLPMYLILVFGDFTADIMWYCVGRFGTRTAIFKYGHIVGITPEAFEKVREYFHKYHQKILIISKLTMGFGFALVILVVAGMFRVKFKNYVILNLLGGFLWTAILLTIGYFLGNVFMHIPQLVKIIFLCTIPLVFIFGIKYINNYLTKKQI